jgi:multiple sugar transport system permease protein
MSSSSLATQIRYRHFPWRRLIAVFLMSIIAIAFIVPFYWMIISSLKDRDEVWSWPIVWFPTNPLWNNYPDAWNSYHFDKLYINTVIITVLRVLGTVLSSTCVAYAFACLRAPGKNVMFILLLSTLMLPSQVTLIPIFMVWHELGALDSYWPLVLPSFFSSAFDVFLLRQFFLTIPPELGNAAKIDGASELGILRRIYIPLMKPALAVVAIFTFQSSWGDFFLPLIYLSDPKKMPISYGIYLFKGEAQKGTITYWHHVMAMSVVMVIPPILLFFISQKQFVQGIVLTGMKG